MAPAPSPRGLQRVSWTRWNWGDGSHLPAREKSVIIRVYNELRWLDRQASAGIEESRRSASKRRTLSTLQGRRRRLHNGRASWQLTLRACHGLPEFESPAGRHSCECRTIFARAIGIAILVTLSAYVGHAAGPRTGGKIQLDDLLGKARVLPGLKDEVQDEKPIVHVALTPSTAKAGSVVTLSVTVSLPARHLHLFDESRRRRGDAHRCYRCGRTGAAGRF